MSGVLMKQDWADNSCHVNVFYKDFITKREYSILVHVFYCGKSAIFDSCSLETCVYCHLDLVPLVVYLKHSNL